VAEKVAQDAEDHETKHDKSLREIEDLRAQLLALKK